MEHDTCHQAQGRADPDPGCPDPAFVFPDPPDGGSQPDDRAKRGAACEEQEHQTGSAEVAGAMMAPQTRCRRVTEQSENERTGAESRRACDQQKVLNVLHGTWKFAGRAVEST